MNRNDLKLFIVLFIVIIIAFAIYFLTTKKASYALVYYKSEIIKRIDLNIDNIYEVDGELGKVTIEVKGKKIRVQEETSPNNICSKQGFVENTNESIICLPNKIIITLPGESDIDTEVR